MSFDWDVQYVVKQGPNWYNLTRTYKAKRKAVSFASLDEIDEVETSSLCGKLTVKTHCERSYCLVRQNFISLNKTHTLTHKLHVLACMLYNYLFVFQLMAKQEF